MQPSMVYQEVSTWPRRERLALASHLLQTLQQVDDAEMTPERQEAILSLIGIWKTEQAVDEKQILDEERMKKYG